MSAFIPLQQMAPTATPGVPAAFPTHLNSEGVLSTPTDDSQQQQQQQQCSPPSSSAFSLQKMPVLFTTTPSNNSGQPAVFARNTMMSTPSSASGPPTPIRSIPIATGGNTSTADTSFGTPVFAASSSFVASPAAPLTTPVSSFAVSAPVTQLAHTTNTSNAGNEDKKTNRNNSTYNNRNKGNSNANAVAGPPSVPATSIFQQTSHNRGVSPAAVAPVAPLVASHSVQRVPAFSASHDDRVWNSTSLPHRQPPHFTRTSPPAFPRDLNSAVAFNPMSIGAKRGRGGAVFGGRGAGRGDVSSTRPAVLQDSTAPRPWQLQGGTAFPTTPVATNNKHHHHHYYQQQQEQHTRERYKQGVSDTRGQLPCTRAFIAFMNKVVDENEARREKAVEILEAAFFGVVGSHGCGEFPVALQQMLAAWQTLKESRQSSLSKGEHWVALFALGCHLNFVASTFRSAEGEPHEEEVSDGNQRSIVLNHKWSVLSNSCTYANLLCDICLQLFTNQGESHIPYGVLPFVLRRARNTFELANDEGVFSVQTNLKTILLKLHRHVRVPVLQQAPQSVVERQRVTAFAYVLAEMLLHSCAPPESNMFIHSFHQYCGDMIEIRSTLYHHRAHNFLQEPLTDTTIAQAMELLARAYMILPDTSAENKRLLFVKLTACGLALGKIPPVTEQNLFNLTELDDLIVAVQSSNIRLFNTVIERNSEFYVRCGIHNVLQVIGKRISLLMVVRYYMNSFSSRLLVQDMLSYYQMPLTTQEGCNVWLLPLLVEKRINGVIESGVLVLSGANPFDDYSHDMLKAFAARNASPC